MNKYLVLGKYSFGMGDRFGLQGKAQLQACRLATGLGAHFVPVWNKSNREHTLIGTDPASTRAAADAAVQALGWNQPYHVDADHIRRETVDRFIPHSDFFTIDVADSLGKPAAPASLEAFVDRHPELTGTLTIPRLEQPFPGTREQVGRIAGKFLVAVQEAGAIYRHIAQAKGAETFITEISMDETDQPQTPPELMVILAAMADEQIPLQTIAPKFTGRFNKGVDYVGNVRQFEQEFREDLAVIDFAIERYNLPPSLKLSIHSGSDKFSLYRPMQLALKQFNAGIHLKTAGTTWLEELIGLAEAGGDGLKIVQDIYAIALEEIDELTLPYATVIDIDRTRLPSAAAVRGWDAGRTVAALRHVPANPGFNPSFRQLMHVSFKVPLRLGGRYFQALKKYELLIARNVTENLFLRHLRPLLLEK